MVSPANPNFPGMAGEAKRVVNGEAIIDTGLKEIFYGFAVPNQSNVVPDEEANVSWYIHPDKTKIGVIVIRVEKGGANHGVLGDSDFTVSWGMHGR